MSPHLHQDGVKMGGKTKRIDLTNQKDLEHQD